MENNFSLDSISTESEENNKYVYRTGLIFRAGAYPDKRFKITPEELLAVASDFSPVPLDVEHGQSIFDGKLGTLDAVHVSEDGWSLYGTAKIPKWLDELQSGEPFKVSCTWTPKKDLVKLALVCNPRITDAALMSAFTANLLSEDTSGSSDEYRTAIAECFSVFSTGVSTSAGMNAFQTIHDSTTTRGAVCADKSAATELIPNFMSEAEMSIIQTIHDIAVVYGAECDSPFTTDSGSTFNNEELMNLTEIVERLTKLATSISAKPAEVSTKTEVEESSSQESETFAVTATEEVATETEVAEEVVETTEAPDAIVELSAVVQDLQHQLEAAKAEAAEKAAQAESAQKSEALVKEELVNREAKAFTDKLIAEGKEVPANADFVQSLYVMASGGAKFSNGNAFQVADIELYFANKATSNLTEEQLGDATLLTTGTTESTDPLASAKKLAADYAAKLNKQGNKK